VARPSGGPNGAVFLTLWNTTPRDEQLSGAESPVCAVTELHDHVREESGGQVRWRMRAIPVLDLPAQQGGQRPAPVVLASGGKHIMLMQLRQPLVEGDTFPLTLRFRESPPVTVTVRVTRDVPLQ
jgi:copper(I)-binding protein